MGLFDIFNGIKSNLDSLIKEQKKNQPKKKPKFEPIKQEVKTQLKEKTKPQQKTEPVNPYAHVNPALKEKYNLIVRQIKLRQAEIDRLEKNSDKLQPLQNELAAYKKAADRIKASFK